MRVSNTLTGYDRQRPLRPAPVAPHRPAGARCAGRDVPAYGYNRGMTLTTTGMVPLGYGKFVRADEIVALVPIDEGARGDGRRTYVHTEGMLEPIVASRSQKAILADMEKALTAPELHRRRLFTRRIRDERRRETT